MSCSQLHALGEATGTLLDREAYRRATAELVRVGSHLIRMIVAIGAKKLVAALIRCLVSTDWGGREGLGRAGRHAKAETERSLTKKLCRSNKKYTLRVYTTFPIFF
jgi:hypothetical protein